MTTDSDIDARLDEAYALHREGAVTEAAEIYLDLLRAQPDHAEALNLLGSAELQLGHIENAEGLLRRAVAVEDAEPRYRLNLAASLVKLGRLAEAIAELENAVAIDADFKPGWSALSGVLRMLGKSDEADDVLARSGMAGSGGQGDAQSHLQTARTLLEEGQDDQAIALARQARDAAPRDKAVQTEVAEIAANLKRWTMAASCHENLTHIEPLNVSHIINWSEALFEDGEYGKATAAYEKVIELEGPSAGRFLDLARIALNGQHLDAAIANVDKAIELDPGMAEAHFTLARYHTFAGDYGRAEAACRKTLDLDPDHSGAYLQLAEITKPEADDPIFEKLATLCSNPELTELARYYAAFALGHVQDGIGRHDDAFESFALANRERLAALGGKGESYDRGKQEREVKAIREIFARATFDGIKVRGSESELPIFIVGMPRSGTTLVEQILTSHAAVEGAGEHRQLKRIHTLFDYQIKNDEETTTGSILWAEARNFADDYLQSLPRAGDGVRRVTDKMPINFLYLGLAAFLLPNARVIHLKRDPLDTCLSIYCRAFPEAYNFAHDLADIGHYYNQYTHLMDHWREVLPLPILDVVYEELVADQETVSRQIVDFCGLDWDPACLDFHKNKRPTFTFSELQVRRPIYSSSIGRWRHFENHLGPLMEALDSDITAAGSP